jgi:hypothetical protein
MFRQEKEVTWKSDCQTGFRILTPSLSHEKHLPGNIGQVWTHGWLGSLLHCGSWECSSWECGECIQPAPSSVVLSYSYLLRHLQLLEWLVPLRIPWESWVQSIRVHTYISPPRCAHKRKAYWLLLVLLVCRNADEECNFADMTPNWRGERNQ